MESQIRHPPASSVVLCREGSEKGQWPLPTFLSGRKPSTSSCLDARHFSSSLCATGAFQAATPSWSSEGVSLSKSMWEYFKRNCFRLQNFLPPSQQSQVFAARSCGDLSSWHWSPGLEEAQCGSWDSSLPSFYPLHVDFGPAHSISAPVLPVWIGVVSLILQLSDFHSAQFLTVLSDGCSVFSCNFDVVVGGGEPCLPMSPSCL